MDLVSFQYQRHNNIDYTILIGTIIYGLASYDKNIPIELGVGHISMGMFSLFPNMLLTHFLHKSCQFRFQPLLH